MLMQTNKKPHLRGIRKDAYHFKEEIAGILEKTSRRGRTAFELV
jgi:hypothetical protein